MTEFWNNRRKLAIALIAWNIFDIMLHVVVDQVEPLRVTGNIVAIAASAVIGWAGISDTAKAGVAGVAIAGVLGLNVAWGLAEGEWWPPIATLLITGSLLLLSRSASVSANPGAKSADRSTRNDTVTEELP